MKINWTLLLTFASLLLGVSPAYAQSASEPEGKPFHISSRGSAFGVQGEFEGTYHISDSSVEIHVTKGTLYVSEHCSYQGRRRINYIKFGLWNHGSSGWKIENRAQPLYLYAVMSPREEHHMSDLHFSLRSEEHTSELQSLAYLVCRLLLEKKNTKANPNEIERADQHEC